MLPRISLCRENNHSLQLHTELCVPLEDHWRAQEMAFQNTSKKMFIVYLDLKYLDFEIIIFEIQLVLVCMYGTCIFFVHMLSCKVPYTNVKYYYYHYYYKYYHYINK